ncbi:hypothetical protein NTG1052_940004 [Candidatus Nitrotoga sp. 1052]|nr:hypothetical protein NTG1052_940004 [Candidatus Nitrotoga sp. 1052]
MSIRKLKARRQLLPKAPQTKVFVVVRVPIAADSQNQPARGNFTQTMNSKIHGVATFWLDKLSGLALNEWPSRINSYTKSIFCGAMGRERQFR